MDTRKPRQPNGPARKPDTDEVPQRRPPGPTEASGIPELLSSADVEAIFDRSDRALRDWVRKGRLRKVKIGHSVFYRAEDVRRLVAEGLSQAVLDRSGKSQRTRSKAPRRRRNKPP